MPCGVGVEVVEGHDYGYHPIDCRQGTDADLLCGPRQLVTQVTAPAQAAIDAPGLAIVGTQIG